MARNSAFLTVQAEIDASRQIHWSSFSNKDLYGFPAHPISEDVGISLLNEKQQCPSILLMCRNQCFGCGFLTLKVQRSDSIWKENTVVVVWDFPWTAASNHSYANSRPCFIPAVLTPRWNQLLEIDFLIRAM